MKEEQKIREMNDALLDRNCVLVETQDLLLGDLRALLEKHDTDSRTVHPCLGVKEKEELVERLIAKAFVAIGWTERLRDHFEPVLDDLTEYFPNLDTRGSIQIDLAQDRV